MIAIISSFINFIITILIVFVLGFVSGILGLLIEKLMNKKVVNMSKVFYLAGGIEDFGKENFNMANDWRTDIKSQIEEISEGRVLCCNPNEHFNFLKKTYDSEKEIMEYDLHKVRKSEVVIVNFNVPKSIGTACELAIAHECKIPIVGLCENGEMNMLHPWLKEFCSRIFTDREDLVLYTIQHYVNGD